MSAAAINLTIYCAKHKTIANTNTWWQGSSHLLHQFVALRVHQSHRTGSTSSRCTSPMVLRAPVAGEPVPSHREYQSHRTGSTGTGTSARQCWVRARLVSLENSSLLLSAGLFRASISQDLSTLSKHSWCMLHTRKHYDVAITHKLTICTHVLGNVLRKI